MIIIFSILLVVTIYCKYKSQKFYRLFKPTLSLLIIIFPLLSANLNKMGAQLILAGLTTSFVGDIFLLDNERYFKHGLISFLFTHLFYSISFIISINKFNFQLSVLYLIIFLLMLYFFRQVLNYSIGFYIFTILLMGYFASNLWLQSKDSYSTQIFVASILFVLSDFTLAVNKFKNKFYLAELLILSTYYSAQYLFAQSIFNPKLL